VERGRIGGALKEQNKELQSVNSKETYSEVGGALELQYRARQDYTVIRKSGCRNNKYNGDPRTRRRRRKTLKEKEEGPLIEDQGSTADATKNWVASI